MPRRCTVCDSPKRAEIDRALVARTMSFRALARRYRLRKDAVFNHFDEHLPTTLARAHEASETARAIDIMNELQRCFDRVGLLFDACDRWLRDADNPAQYDIGPRAENVRVTYSETVDGKTRRRKALLSELLTKVAGVAPDVELVTVKYADPRELVLKTAERLQGQLELLARLLGKIKEPAHINVFVTNEWQQVQSAILDVLTPHPHIRLQVAEALGRLADASRN